MEEVLEIDTFWKEFTNKVSARNTSEHGKIFRGVANFEFELIPSIGRGTKKGTLGDVKALEKTMMDEFKRLSNSILESNTKTEFEWLFLAQHYGLPTRLLDWTTNPFVALFFAINDKNEKDGVVYMTKQHIQDNYELFDPYMADYLKGIKSVFQIQPHQGDVIFIRPRYTDTRYLNQKSVFSCHANPDTILDVKKLDIEIINIPYRFKQLLRDRLRIIGISESFLYPGLSGIASEVRNLHYKLIKDCKANYVYAEC